MRPFLLLLICLLFNAVSVSQLKQVKTLSTERKYENPVSFATIFANKYLYNILTYTADGKATNELWISDGSEAGTILLSNAQGDFLSGGAVGNNYLFFKSYYAADGNTLVYDCWKTDGTIAGTALIKAALASGRNDGSSYTRRPRNFTVLNNWLYFFANGGTARQELWKTNGSVTDTVKTDFEGLDYFKGLYDLTAFKNQLYFLIKSTDNNNDSAVLWKSDGSYPGTVPVLFSTDRSFLKPDLSAGVVYQDKLIFVAEDSLHGRELWITDGSAGGTRLLTDAVRGSDGSFPSNLTLIGNKLYFFENYGNILSVFDFNTNSKTRLTDATNVAYGSTFTHNNKLLFKSADRRRGLEWFMSDGTVAGTSLLADVRKGMAGAFDYVSDEAEISAAAPNGKFYFTANDGIHGSELWVTDLTVPGTKLFADAAPGSAWSSPKFLKVIQDKLFFVAYNKKDWVLQTVSISDAPVADNGYVPFKQGEWLQTFGARPYEGAGYFNNLEGLATDSKSNVFLTGHFIAPDNNFVFFDSDTIANGNSKYPGYTYKDYLVKLTPDGKFSWYKNNGGSDFFAYNAIAVDKNDEIVAAGGATPPVVFDSTVIENRSGVFLSKYDTAGNLKWARIFDCDMFSNIHHVTTDANNNIIVGGVYRGNSINMGNGIVANTLYTGQYFIAKTDASGNPAWVANIPVYVGSQGYIKKIITDGSDNVYVLTTLFAPNTTANGCITDTTYIQISKFNPAGKFLWNKKFNALGVINAQSLTIDAAGLLNVTGYFAGQAFIEKYILRSGYDLNCTRNEIIQVQMRLSDGSVTGVGRYDNQTTNVLDIKTNADGTYYLLGYKIKPNQVSKIEGFEASPYSSPAQQLTIEHRFYNGKLIDSKSWNVSSQTYFSRSYFANTPQNDFVIATCGAQYIDTFANGVSNFNQNVSAWKFINTFKTPSQPVVSYLSEIRVLNNPATSKLILSLPGTGVTGQVNVYNSIGQLVQQQTISGGLSIIAIDVERLSSGIYFVNLPVANGRQTIKFLKK